MKGPLNKEREGFIIFSKVTIVLIGCLLISACGTGTDLKEANINEPPPAIVEVNKEPTPNTVSEEEKIALENMGACPNNSLFETSNYDKYDQSNNKANEAKVNLTNEVVVEGYSVTLPKEWEVISRGSGALSLHLNKKEIGVIETYGPTMEFIPLNISKNDDIVKCKELTGLAAGKGIKLLLHRTPSAGDSEDKPHNLIQYNIVIKDEKRHRLFKINFDRREAAEHTATEIIKTFEPKG